MTVIRASPALSNGAEVATTPVNNETITAIADWPDITVIPKETEDGPGRRFSDTWSLGKDARFGIFISRFRLVTANPAFTAAGVKLKDSNLLYKLK